MPNHGHTRRFAVSRRASLVVAGMTVLATVGCGKMGQLTAMKNFKEANASYGQQDYKKAAELYEATVKADPNLNYAYFYLGNSYDNLYKPSKKGEQANDALLENAVKNYQTAAEKLATGTTKAEKDLARLSLKYLVASYGADKLNDPARAEPVVQRMIQLDPGEPENYFALAKIYEDAGAYENAEDILVKAKQAKPSDPAVYKTLAGYYNRQGQFEKTIKEPRWAASDPKSPESRYHRRVVLGRAFATRLTETQKGLRAERARQVEKGVGMKPD